ncbi:major capsid protein [Streptomyces anthocyanicus]|uniref:major capsid protein n=1 Tax=Streptomyces anthocyanicus TaxID=68174 RepID=UPI0033D0CB75
MQLITDYVPPVDLSGYAREALADFEENAFTLSQWLPSEAIDRLDFEFNKGGGGLVEAAVFRSYDAESDIGHRAGATRATGMLPPISRKIPVGEYEQLKEMNLSDREGVRDTIEKLAEKLTREIAARIEIARGDAIFNGAVTIDENGVSASVDFGRDPDHTVTLDGVTDALWDDTETSKPFDNFTEWVEVYEATTGERPAFALMPERILRLLQRNAQLCRMASTDAVPPVMLTVEELNALLADHELPQVVTNDSRVVFKGVTTRVTPADKVALLPAPGDSLGKTLWGTPVEANDSAYGFTSADRAGILAGNFRSEDPQTLWTRTVAIALPVVAAPDRSFVAKVV